MNCICGKKGNFRCKGCGVAKYCSMKCQRQAWPTHKKECGKKIKLLCPFCKIRTPEDDFEQGLCADCGALFCSKCIIEGAHTKLGKCPKCNVNLSNRTEKSCLKRLHQLEKKIVNGKHPEGERILTYLYIAIAGRYLKGRGTKDRKPELSATEEYYLKASRRGSPVADYNLYCIYTNPLFDDISFTEKKEESGKEYLKRAVDAGYHKALCSKAMEMKVNEEKKDNKILISKIKKAVVDKKALVELFKEEETFMTTAIGLPDEALALLKRSALLGYDDAQFELGVVFQFCQEPQSAIVRGMSEEKITAQMTNNARKAIFWYEKAASQNHGLAANNLGVIYKNGIGCIANKEKALEYYVLSGSLGCCHGKFGIGAMHEELAEETRKKRLTPFITTTKYNELLEEEHSLYKRAVFYYQQAANEGFTPGIFQIGFLMVTNRLPPENNYDEKSIFEDGLLLIKDAAERGNGHAQQYLKKLSEK